jgi:methanogenic corrinoid protein MtbC1
MISEERKRDILDAIRNAVVQFDEDQCTGWCKTALREGLDAYETTIKGLDILRPHIRAGEDVLHNICHEESCR